MGTLNQAQMAKLVDDWWQDDIQETDEFTHAFYKRCEALPEANAGVNGRKVKVRTGYNASESTAGADGAAVATGDASSFENLYVPYRFYTKTCLFTKEALDADDVKSQYHPAVEELASARLEGMKSINRHFLMGDPKGTIAIATGVDTGQTIPFAPTNGTFGTKGAQFARVGKTVEIWQGDGSAQRTGGGADKIVVASSVLSTGVVTFTGTVPTDAASGDIMVAEDSANKGISGLEYIVAATGDYYDLTRATYGLESTYVDGSSGSLLLLVEKMFAASAFKVGAAVSLGVKGEGKREGWWSPTQRQAYRQDSLGLGITMLGSDKLDAGYAHKEEINAHSFTCEPDHSNDKIHFLKMNHFRRIVRGNAEKPLEILPIHGQSVYNTYNSDSTPRPTTQMATTLCAYINLHCEDLRAQAAIHSLPTDGLETGN